MNTMRDPMKNYAVAVLFSAVGSGLFVTLVTKAVPKMLPQMMAGMMKNMMSQMSENGCDPSEM